MSEALNPYKSFKHLKSSKVDLLNLTVHEYQHKKTGARHYHFASDSDENVFLVGFRTVPEDSKGVAHILEHTSLCGSDKYPVRDPFFMMLRRSLNTFMNALTSSDWTAYPFASANRKDFHNLLEVYLDAVFFTRLDELDFKQEGHRLEFATEGDSNSDLTYKGVVYNEMKGAMSSTDSQLWHGLCEHLYQDTTYHHNSGGNPENILELSYEELLAFHKKHYHPSNAIFMTYGNIAPNEHQANFEDFALTKFQASEHDISIPLEKRFRQPKKVESSYPVQASDKLENKTYHVMAWLLGPITDFQKRLEAHFLNGVLLGDSAAPLLAALESTDLGSSPSSMCGLDDSNLQMNFLCGIEGSEQDKVDAFEALVMNVLNEIADNGIVEERLETVLHQLELSQRKMSGAHYPYGLGLILGALSSAVHRGDVLEALDIDPILTKMRTAIKDPNYIKNLVKSLLLDNTHRLTYTMVPDATLNDIREKAVIAKLADIKKTLSDTEKNEIITMTKALKERQEAEEDPSALPKVDLDDVPNKINIPTPTLNTKWHNNNITLYGAATNGMTYQDILMPIPELNNDLLPLLPLYSNCLTEVGCGSLDYQAMNAWQSKVTGGVSMRTTFKTDMHHEQQFKADFILSANALARNQEAMGELVLEMLENVRFDEHDRIHKLISQIKSSWNDDIVSSGHGYAMASASSAMSPVSHLAYNLTGMQGIANLNQLEPTLKDKKSIKALADQLATIHENVKSALKSFLVVAEENNVEKTRAEVEALWKKSPLLGQKSSIISLPETRQTTRQLWVCNTQVNFCAKAYPTVPFGHEDYAKLLVLSGFLRNGFLHQAIREKGGAYGGGANQDSTSASFRFFSYRDPRGIDTFNDFDRAIEWLLSQKHEYRPLEEAILGVIGALDKPGTPVSEARAAFYDAHYGITSKIFHQLRSQVLAVTIDNLKDMANTYLKDELASVGVLTHEQGAKEEFSSLDLEVNYLEKAD